MEVIRIKNEVKYYQYMSYLSVAINEGADFKSSRVNQLGARLSGKTTSDNIELIRAILAARRKKVSLVVFIFRMRHKEVIQAWGDIVQLLHKYKLPIIINKGAKLIKLWTTKIYVKGCYTMNSTEISLLGVAVQHGKDYGIIVFEEAKEFDKKTVDAVFVAIRGIKYQTSIFRSNPYLLSNWFVQECYSNVSIDEQMMFTGSGNQLEDKGQVLYHYMRADVNQFIDKPNLDYLERIKKDNPLLARTEFYGLPGSNSGMVFAHILHKIKTEFEMKRWEEFTAGVDVGHVSSATAASLWALEPTHMWKVGEYYHSNKDERFLEAVELAQEVLAFFAQQKDKFKFKELDCFVDNADPGFISLLNTEARKQGKNWFIARPCVKTPIENRISCYTYTINKQIVGIHKTCKKTLQELSMLAYDEKAEDDKVKLVKQNDHAWDADMYALTAFMGRYINYDSL